MQSTTVGHINQAQFEVYIGRPWPQRGLGGSIWANPYKIGSQAAAGHKFSRAEALAWYESLVRWRLGGPNGDWWRRELEQLRGKRLGCWGDPKPCHGDVLIKILAELKLVSVEHRQRDLSTILARHPGAAIIDVTSQGGPPWNRFSPFYPHGNIPVPFSPGHTSQTVAGIWQGLKVFEGADIDSTRFCLTSKAGMTRSSRQYGQLLGHRAGLGSDVLLPDHQARLKIYLPAYRWVLDHCLGAEVALLRAIIEQQRRPLVLLDDTLNTTLEEWASPLSHAGLVAMAVQGTWPEKEFSALFRQAGECLIKPP